jgi:hypothetical protein
LRRIDTVRVTDGRETAELPWESREALLQRLADFPVTATIVAKFKDAGTTAPVALTEDEKTLLRHMINWWADEVRIDELPEGVWELRCVISDEPN